MARLTDTQVRRTKPGRQDRWLADGGGLYLRISPSGARVWWFRQTRRGRRIQERLGSLAEYGLAEARLKAAERALAPTDPEGRTVKALAERWFREVIQPDYRRPHHVRGFLDRAIILELGAVQVRKVTRAAVVDMLAAYRKRGAVATNRLRNVTAQMFDYGLELGWLDVAPTNGITRRVAGGREASRSRVLTDAEICRVWHAGEPHQALLRILLLTGLRIGEAQAARWRDLDGSRLHVPAENAKNGRAHWVHLPALARRQLGEAGKPEELILRSVSPTAVQSWLRRWCERAKLAPRFTPHDLRRTFATRLNSLGIAPHVVERMLNHTMQGVMAIYNRSEYEQERITAADLWAAELVRILDANTAGVVNLDSRR